MNSHNIASLIRQMAKEQAHKMAVCLSHGRDTEGRVLYSHDTFLQLEQRSNRMAIVLERMGITRGMRTVLMVTPGSTFFALTFALFKIGAIPVMVDPGMGVKNLKTCLAEAEPEAFIGEGKAHVARLLFAWAKRTLRIKISLGTRWFWGGFHLAQALAYIPMERSYDMVNSKADDLAAILFTSGSTGIPKGAIYTHGNFMAQIKSLRQCYNIKPGDVDLPTFPLFALFAPALGMTAIIPSMDFTRPAQVEPQRLIEAIEDFGVTSMFGSPALIYRLAMYGQQQGVRLPSLQRVISAGAPVSADVLAQFVPMLNNECRVFTPYGATEALPVCSISSDTILQETAVKTAQGNGVCVGLPAPGITLRIIAIDDQKIATWSDNLTIADGEIGEIVVKGEQVTHAYYGRSEATALAKIIDPKDGACWHRMGDVGHRDSEGKVWFCGRKTHRVITKEKTLFTIPCEAIFNKHAKVFRSALVGIKHEEEIIPIVCIELLPDVAAHEQAAIRQALIALAAANSITAMMETILFHPKFPVDVRHNAKIFREKLALWAAEVLA
ncbi:MAG: fatty acid CoA ligase family protein [Mariprofundaceae bacterium]|nr:fatty acid CoA ligase family protein [Mariprofundaceae bacterium]